MLHVGSIKLTSIKLFQLTYRNVLRSSVSTTQFIYKTVECDNNSDVGSRPDANPTGAPTVLGRANNFQARSCLLAIDHEITFTCFPPRNLILGFPYLLRVHTLVRLHLTSLHSYNVLLKPIRFPCPILLPPNPWYTPSVMSAISRCHPAPVSNCAFAHGTLEMHSLLQTSVPGWELAMNTTTSLL